MQMIVSREYRRDEKVAEVLWVSNTLQLNHRVGRTSTVQLCVMGIGCKAASCLLETSGWMRSNLKSMTDCSGITGLYKVELFIQQTKNFRIRTTKAVKSNCNFWSRFARRNLGLMLNIHGVVGP